VVSLSESAGTCFHVEYALHLALKELKRILAADKNGPNRVN